MNVKILVSTHKPYKMPVDSELYLPIQVGCDEVAERFGFQGDNTGDNISYKHRFYSDLSAVYWGWKNLDVDYMGSCHYRRYFVSKKAKNSDDRIFRYILSRDECEKLLAECPIIVAKKRHYYIETIESHYKHSHYPKAFDTTREVIKDICPEYLDFFNQVASQTSAHMFNTFIMRKDYLDSFCSFLFPVLFEVEKRTDFSGLNEFESRICGYIAEFLLDTWLNKNSLFYQECTLALLEKQSWTLKIGKFIMRKFLPSSRTFSTAE